jgi:hypothetical protein
LPRRIKDPDEVKKDKHTPENIEKMAKLVLGHIHSEEVRKAMSESRKGINNPFYGKSFSVETLNKYFRYLLNPASCAYWIFITFLYKLSHICDVAIQGLRTGCNSVTSGGIIFFLSICFTNRHRRRRK